MPVVEQFGPALVLVSAGYDAHARDPLGGMKLDGLAYGWMTKQLLAVGKSGQVPMGLLLEGGYDLQGVTDGVAHTISALMGREPNAEPTSTNAITPRHEAELARAAASASSSWQL